MPPTYAVICVARHQFCKCIFRPLVAGVTLRLGRFVHVAWHHSSQLAMYLCLAHTRDGNLQQSLYCTNYNNSKVCTASATATKITKKIITTKQFALTRFRPLSAIFPLCLFVVGSLLQLSARLQINLSTQKVLRLTRICSNFQKINI